MAVKETTDGSFTFFSEKFNQTYHSVHGAKTESDRVFLELGLEFVIPKFEVINILEVGFGTGLNAFLTQNFKSEKQVNYTGLEAYPLSEKEYRSLPNEIQLLHELSWETTHKINPKFSFLKKEIFLENYSSQEIFQLIYFDAFSPEAQPELWTQEIFEKMYNLLEKNGVLTTYCSKGLVQRNLKSAGFEVEKHKGPPHKREILRAIKH